LTLTTVPVAAQQPNLTQAQAQAMVSGPGGFQQFVWQLFVQATQPAGNLLTFETWAEQCQLNPNLFGCQGAGAAANTTANRPRGHVSGLLLANRSKAANAPITEITQTGLSCGAMNAPSSNSYPAPANVKKNPPQPAPPNSVFCEQVFVNAAEQAFVTQNGLTTLTGQQTFGSNNGGAITFPWNAIEVKADWVPTTSYTGPTFSCPDQTHKLYTQVYNGVCYALVGLHISSKLLPDWVWATFEPASSITNPDRCDPALYSTCFDPWGTTSSVPYGKGQTVPQSPQLHQLMASAGLDEAFNNYFLTGVQWQFVDNNNKPIPLGSSFVEFNAQVPPGQASCITCHRYAYFDGKNPNQNNPPLEDNFGGAPQGWNNIGYACNTNQNSNCTPVVPNSTSQDFSWMLGMMPYQ
jgi:hypothetical protein